MHSKKQIYTIIIVSALGYFVDIYDLILFSIVRLTSLQGLGITDKTLLTSDGILLLNMQMLGMLIGGIIWGILGDKKGRLSVLFGSIFLYSVANIINGFVQTIPQYATLRFVAGLGLAGELGAGITLVSEVMAKETRGYGTMLVASVGILGAVVASLVGDFFNWRTAFFIGGIMGIALLIMRIGVFESKMYESIRKNTISRGNFLQLFKNYNTFSKYLNCILIGIPIWFIVSILITLSPEFATAFNIPDKINPGTSIMFCYIGLAVGDISSGILSQILKSRIKIIKLFIMLCGVFILVYLFLNKFNSFYFYSLCLILGISGGYWAVFVTNASEQFGTNLRATVTTTVPNFVRGAVVPVTLFFQFLAAYIGIVWSAFTVGIFTVLLAYFSVRNLKESYGKDLDFLEMS
jgi:MFS transporter, putative metabolite:H+ symporter